MSNTAINKIGLSHVPDYELSIISRREIEPLLASSRQILAHYDEAMGCCSSVIDKSGRAIRTQEYKYLFRFCDFCRKYCNHSLEIWKGAASPCEDIHKNALLQSRRGEGTHIYTCPIGIAYWTSPLYRNGRYAGALTAGQVLSCGREAATEKIRAVCKYEGAAEKFSKMLEGVPEKTHEEIQAMARLLAVCAGEISGKKEDTGGMVRRMTRQEAEPKTVPKTVIKASLPKTQQKPQPKTDQAQTRGIAMENPIEKERMLLAAFRRGDIDTGSRILNELMINISQAVPDNFEIVRFRAIELAVLLSRAAEGEFAGCDALLEGNNRYMGRILDSENTEELMENLQLAAKRMADKIFSFQGIRHSSVLRRAERYIWDNYSRKLSLDEIAKASGLSAPYFCSIFKEEMGENLSRYLNRLRVEKAASLLTDSGKTLHEIALLCGFEDQSWFSKIFKSFSGLSPGKYREHGCRLTLRTDRNHVNYKENIPIGVQKNYERQIQTNFG